MRLLLLIILLWSTHGVCQSISSAQQKALNNYVLYADYSVEEMSSIVVSIMKYYPTIHEERKNSSPQPRYSCPVQLEEYYYKTALTESSSLGVTNASTLNKKIASLKAAAEKIDANCKALDTYHKLEDYKKDNLAGAETMINKFPPLFDEYRKAQQELINEVEVAYKKMAGDLSAQINQRAIMNMRKEMQHEKAFLDLWKYNLEHEIPTGWPDEQLASSILQTDKFIKENAQVKLNIKYPASSMYSSFNEGMVSILESKRLALDGYNAEARKSDEYANSAYLGLINYYNGVLVSFYNSFIDYAKEDGFRGLKAVRYLPEFEIRNKQVEERFQIVPFVDAQHAELKVPAQTTAITANATTALNNYADFINECIRQIRFLHVVVRNLSSSAASFRGLTSFQGKGRLDYDYQNYKVPLSLYQKTVSESVSLKAEYAKHLNGQVDVMLGIMKEMEQLSEAMQRNVDNRQYEKDKLKYLDEIFDRYRFLFETIDTKKEILYSDVRKVYDSYPFKNSADNWIISWKALRQLVDDDHMGLFQAKDYYLEKTTNIPSTAFIDEHLREVLSNEYENMKGIEKYGRYNGLCPYTPYEDIPKNSRSLSEKFLKVNEVKSYSNRHPYDDLVYLYNSVVDDFNKFTELSKHNLLKTIHQPAWIDIETEVKGVHEAHPVKAITPAVTEKQISNVDGVNPAVQSQGSKIVHDTVYIEKRDTIYLADPGEDLRSMEGYAINNMVLLLDVSGSMNAPDKLPLLKTSVLNLLSMMRKEDQVSIVIYSGKAKVLLQPTSFKDENKIRNAINELTSSGKTDGNAGIKLAYQVADKNYLRGGNNRIILATDGEFPIGEDVFAMADRFSKEDIFLSVFNFGKTTSSAKNLEKLSSNGKGNYEHISKENMEIKLIREAKSKKAK